MKNDTYYFSHDSNAKDDPKCVMLIEQLGCEGYGIFWILIETLRSQPDFKYPFNLVGALARRYNTSGEKMTTVIKMYGLFQVEDDMFFSLRLMRAMEEYNAKKLRYIKAGSSGGQASVKKRLSIGQAIKGKESKVNKRKRNKNSLPPAAESVKAFYEKEQADNTSGEFIKNYSQLVSWLYGKNEKTEPFKNVLSLPEQISYKQFVSMKKKSEATGVTIKEIINEMENRKTLCTNNISASLTAMNWMQRNAKREANV
jgi:hypothetical protein